MLRLLALLCLCLAPVVVRTQNVLGCGGFIRSKGNIDFSRIDVELYTKQGSLKDKTDCAPNNGYYFIPIEENGDYKLKVVPPLGWRMIPEEVEISFDGKTDRCSKNEDINFEFAGFGITGSVISSGAKSDGPGKIGISLYTVQNELIESTQTNEVGAYVFPAIPPGKYVVRVDNEAIKKFAFEQSERIVTVGEDIGVPEPLIVSGYDVSGSILTEQGQPLSGIKVDIFVPDGKQPLNTATSDETGRFVFKTLPYGRYELRSESPRLRIEPAHVEVQPRHNHQDVGQCFTIHGFSLGGVVRSQKGGKPIPNVEIEITGPKGAMKKTSDSNGAYELVDLVSGTYHLKATLEGFDFAKESAEITGPKSTLPDLVPARYRLSGTVDRTSIPSSIGEIKVKFTAGKDVIGRVLVTEKGTFSIYLPAGKYSASVELNAEDQRRKDIGFAPVEHNVEIKDGPVGDISFVPIKATVSGKVTCLATRCPPTYVTLRNGDSETNLRTVEANEAGKFTFIDVLPGTYKVFLGKDNRCWDSSEQSITVSKDVSDIEFRQLGFILDIDTSHPTTLVYSGDRKAALARGLNSVCIHSDQPVTVGTESCHEFELSSREWDPSNPKKISMRAVRHEVSGSVQSKADIPDLVVEVTTGGNTVRVPTERAGDAYRFSFMASSGSDLVFVPKASEHLFTEDKLQLTMENTCRPDAINFVARRGVFIRGKITPALQGVLVKIKNSELKAFTNTDGTYQIGPLADETKPELVAEKPGYAFEATQYGDFKARKLAGISVSVREGDALMDDVIVSVSGGTAYRSNAQTQQGVATFLALSPGEYFVKPMLKEYEFEPRSQLLAVEEGESKSLVIRAKRVAFSLYGRLASLMGDPEAGVPVAAVGSGEKCKHVEEGISEASGHFRIRGLLPNCNYSVHLSEKANTPVERFIPRVTQVTVGQADVRLPKRLIAMRRIEVMDMNLMVLTKGGYKPEERGLQLRGVLSSADGTVQHSFKALTGYLKTLPTVDKNGMELTVSVETVPDKYQTKKSKKITFLADELFKRLEMVLEEEVPKRKNVKTSPFVWVLIPLIALCTLVYMTWDSWGSRAAEFVEAKWKSWLGGGQAQYSPSHEAGGRKKKNVKKAF